MARFTTSARTIDMLGRQQIAGIPTAISELFKNAYDAYARSAVVDYYPDQNLLILRDDGIGMSATDFETRWLTVGTDSKTAGSSLRALEPPEGLRPRTPLGEKGIGRLAIGSLGLQTLVLTRPRYEIDGRRLTTVALLSWRMFTAPGITLDEIVVPVEQLDYDRETLTSGLINSLTRRIEENLDVLNGKLAPDLRAAVKSDLALLRQVNVESLTRLPGPQLVGTGHGTQFLVTPVDESLEAEISEGAGSASQLVKLLMGFSNTISPLASRPEFRTAFVKRKTDEDPQDLIGSNQFFNPEDFRLADHEVEGRFDERGTFRGTVRIFGGDPKSCNIPFPAGASAPTRCGPFGIRFGYVQGNQRESVLSSDEWVAIDRKLKKIAGLYIYRDGIRILPYGNSDVDYLGLEERRSKNVGYYFFSYRRMFGAVNIDSGSNPDLQEKAGREGFRENLAYRQMVAILQNLFLRLAAQYFRGDSQHGREFLDQRDQNASSVRRRREGAVQPKRNKFQRDLEEVIGRFAEGEPVRAVADIMQSFNAELVELDCLKSSDAVHELVVVDRRVREALVRVQSRYTVTRPVGVGIARNLQRDYASWQRLYDDFLVSTVAPAEQAVDKELAERATRIGDNAQQRLRREASNELSAIVGRWQVGASAVAKLATEAGSRALALIQDAIRQADSAAEDATRRIQQSIGLSHDEILTERRRARDDLQRELSKLRIRIDSLLPILSQLMMDPEAATQEIEALEDELLALRDEADTDLELAQLGRAVEIINHEFAASISGVRNSIKALRPWARSNSKLATIEKTLSASFEHLDAYLTLFTPLQRRLYRRPVSIQGGEVSRFIHDLFDERAGRQDTLIASTTSFDRQALVGYPSTLYPVFINLVDNALFWLSDRPQPRIIELDYQHEMWLIRDNGPGVNATDVERIFELGYTLKPGGRGIGLKVSRDVLRRNGMDLRLRPGFGLPWPPGAPDIAGSGREGACFAIVRKENAARSDIR